LFPVERCATADDFFFAAPVFEVDGELDGEADGEVDADVVEPVRLRVGVVFAELL
jgi:hypothetical protein